MSMRVEVKADPLGVEVDALALIQEIARTMPAFYAGQFLRGQRPEGGARPLNQQGQPLGQGSGGIATNWETSPARGDATRAEVSTGPNTDGGRFYAVRRLVELGSSPVNVEGRAGSLLDQLIDAAADKAVAG